MITGSGDEEVKDAPGADIEQEGNCGEKRLTGDQGGGRRGGERKTQETGDLNICY